MKRYIALTPGEANPWDSLGMVYGEMGEIDEAIAAYKEALKIQPDFWVSNMGLSYLQALKEDYRSAFDSIDRYLSFRLSAERRADALGWKGFCLYLLGRFRESLELYRQAEEAGRDADWSNKSRLHLLISELYLERREFEAARRSVRKWVNHEVERSLQREAGIILKIGDFWEGFTYAREGWPDAARAKLEEMKSALQDFSGFDKENLIENITLLQIEIRLAEPVDADALSNIETNFTWKPGFLNFQIFNFEGLLSRSSPKFMEALARAYAKKGDLDRAIAEHERFVSPDPKKGNSLICPRYYYSLGKLFEGKGMKEKARRHYRRFLELWKDADPGQAEVEDARARLAALR